MRLSAVPNELGGMRCAAGRVCVAADISNEGCNGPRGQAHSRVAWHCGDGCGLLSTGAPRPRATE
jgi:hypothetical protein